VERQCLPSPNGVVPLLVAMPGGGGVGPWASTAAPSVQERNYKSLLHASDATDLLKDHQNTGNNFEDDREVPWLKHWLSSSSLEWIFLEMASQFIGKLQLAV